MDNKNPRRITFFSIAMALVGLAGLTFTFAGSDTTTSNQNSDTGPYRPELEVLTDVVESGETFPEQDSITANKQTYEIPEWGIQIEGVDVDSHSIAGDRLILQTKTLVETRKASTLQTDRFNDCYNHHVELNRISQNLTTRDLNAQPWWTVQQELEAAGAKNGSYYYYFNLQETSCGEDFDLLQTVLPNFQKDSFLIIGNLSGL